MPSRKAQTLAASVSAILFLGIASCDGGGPSGPSSPVFALSSTEILFSDESTQRAVTISNLSDDAIDWRVLSSTASWLTGSPTSGNLGPGGSGTLAIQINRAAVPQGTHSASLHVGAAGQSALVSVSVQEVVAPPPSAALQPSTLTLGSLDSSEIVEVVNTGGSTLNWTLSGPSWVTLTPTSGSLAPGQRTQILVTPNRTNLTNGQYLGNLQLSSNGGARTATLALDVTGAGGIGLEPSSLDFGTTTGQLHMRVRNDGDRAIQWVARPGTDWISVTPASGSLPPRMNQLLSVEVSRSGMTPGRNETTIEFTSDGGSAVARVSAELATAQGTNTSQLSVSPVFLDFEQRATQLYTSLNNNGDVLLEWAAASSASWISLPQAKGTISPNSTSSLPIVISRGGLTAGTYRATIRVTSNGGSADALVEVVVSNSAPQPAPESPGVTPPPGDPSPDPEGPLPASIDVTPSSLDFGSNGTERSLVVRNTGEAALDWQAVTANSYLTVSPVSGRLGAGGSVTIQALVNRSASTTAGLYESAIQLSSNGGNRTIPVSMRVETGPAPPPSEGLSDIDATGTKDVTEPLNAYIASVPDGSVIQFPAGARYRVEGILHLPSRNNLTIEGNGAMVFADTDGSGVTPPQGFGHLWPRARSHVMIGGGSNIVIRDLTVRGANPGAGSATGAYVEHLEGQHGFDVNGATGLTLENVRVTDTYGDFIYLGRDIGGTGTWAQNIVVRNSHFERSGRQGVAIVGASDVFFEGNYIGEVGRTIIDIEPLGAVGGAHRITFQRNTFGPCRHLLLSSGGLGPNVKDIALIGNQLVGMQLKVKAVPADHSRRSGYRIIDNVSDITLGSPAPALKFQWADGIEVRGNYQVMAERRDMIGVYACESTNISVGDNDFSGALQELKVESACP